MSEHSSGRAVRSRQIVVRRRLVGRSPARLLALALAAPLFGGGCFIFHRTPPQPPTIVIRQPIILSPAPVAATPPPPAPTPAPTPPPEETNIAPPPRTPPRRHAPHKPDHPGSSAKTVTAPIPAPAADQPQLTTPLTPAQGQAYRNTIHEWLDAAQHDLQLVSGRALAPEPAANRSQALEYLRQARQAVSQGDLVRAQSLAHKALLLAEAILDTP